MQFLSLDKAIASRAVFDIVSGVAWVDEKALRLAK